MLEYFPLSFSRATTPNRAAFAAISYDKHDNSMLFSLDVCLSVSTIFYYYGDYVVSLTDSFLLYYPSTENPARELYIAWS